jgi:hypothetical protein
MWMAPLTPYAASKLSGEALVSSYIEAYKSVQSLIDFLIFSARGNVQIMLMLP